MSRVALNFVDVHRHFGKKVALDGVSLTVKAGEVLGMIGRNGAGKTTALRLALGTLHPDSGTIRTLGFDTVSQGMAVRTRVSLLSEESALYEDLTVDEMISFAASLHPRWDDDLSDEFRERLHLDLSPKIKTLSRGDRAKVSLLLAVAARPQLLLLDDPTAGIDPLVRREVLEGILDAIPSEGGSVIYASHLIEDVERVADRVLVLDAGKIVLERAIEQLKHEARRVTAIFENSAPEIVHDAALGVRRRGRSFDAVALDRIDALAGTLRQAGARDVLVSPASLEDVLIACLREDASSDDREDVKEMSHV